MFWLKRGWGRSWKNYCRRHWRTACWWIVLGMAFLAGFSGGGKLLGKFDVWYEYCLRERYVMMPERLTVAWVKDRLKAAGDVGIIDCVPGLTCFLTREGLNIGVMEYDREQQLISLCATVQIKGNPILYKLINNMNYQYDFRRVFFDDEQESLFLAMKLDVSAGVTARQVELFCRKFIRGMAEFNRDFNGLSGKVSPGAGAPAVPENRFRTLRNLRGFQPI